MEDKGEPIDVDVDVDVVEVDDEVIDAEEIDVENLDEKTSKASKALTKFVQRTLHDGIGPISGATSFANDRLWRVLKIDEPSGDPRALATEEHIEKAISRVIAESTTMAGTAGAVAGLGGLVTSLALLPVNITGALVINARMVGAIAHLRGYTLRDPLVETFATLLVAGAAVKESIQVAGVQIGTKVTMNLIKAIPMSAIRAINKRAGVYLIAKYGTQRSAVTLAKAVPFVGAAVGGAVDVGFTQLAARRAKAFFEYTAVKHVPAET